MEFTSLSRFHNSCNNTGRHANVKLLNESASHVSALSLRGQYTLSGAKSRSIIIFCVKKALPIKKKIKKCRFFLGGGLVFLACVLSLFDDMYKQRTSNCSENRTAWGISYLIPSNQMCIQTEINEVSNLSSPSGKYIYKLPI